VLVERRVVLLSRDPGLISVTGQLSNGDRITHLRSPVELSDWSASSVAVVVLDSQPQARRLSYKQVRDRYDGPLVMLLDKGERRPDLPPDGARHFLHRPFRVAELSKLLGTPGPQLGQFEAAIIAAWSRHATAEQAAQARRGPSYRIDWRPSLRRRVRAWAATVVALVGLLLVFVLSDQGSCGSACTSFGGGVAGATESGSPLTAPPGGSGAGGGAGRPPGSSDGSSQPPTPAGGGLPVVAVGGGLPVVGGVGELIASINPITSDDTTPPTGPQAVPGVPAAPGADPPPATSPPPTTAPPGTTPPGTNPPPTTGPPTTAPPTTAPPTTDPPTTNPPTTEPPTTAPPTTDPPTTDPPTTDPPTTDPPTTNPPTTEPPTTAPPTTDPPTTAAPPTEAPTTVASPTP
jgi:hypothetical protein